MSKHAVLVALLILGISLAFVPESAHGQTIYFVDRNNSAANDGNAGTSTAPFLTIQRAATLARVGDTVIVRAGTYNERVTFPTGATGEAGRKITIRAEPRRSVTMWGFYTLNANYLRIEGFNITIPDSLIGATEKYGIFIRSDYVEVVDNYFFDIKSTAIQANWGKPWPRNALISSNRIYRSQSGIVVSGDNWIIEHNEVERLVKYGSGDADYTRFFGDGIVFRNNTLRGTLLSEIGAAHVDCWQTFNNNGEYATNVVIENNLCMDAHQGLIIQTPTGPTIRDIIVKNNIFANLWAWGIISGNLTTGFQVFNNTFANIGFHGLGCVGTAQCEVRNNIFYDAGTSYWKDPTATMTASNNIVYRTGTTLNLQTFPNDLVNVNPSFVSAKDGNFRISSESPAINSGFSLPTVTLDRDGLPRPVGLQWDIGAYEYRGAAAAPTAPAAPTNLTVK